MKKTIFIKDFQRKSGFVVEESQQIVEFDKTLAVFDNRHLGKDHNYYYLSTNRGLMFLKRNRVQYEQRPLLDESREAEF